MQSNRRQRRVRLVLLTLLPGLVAVMFAYAKSIPPSRGVVAVDSDGGRIFYTEWTWNPLDVGKPPRTSVDYFLVVRERNRMVRKSVAMASNGSVTVSGDGRFIAVGEHGGGVTIYDAMSLRAIRSGKVFPASFDVGNLAFSRNGRYLAISGAEEAPPPGDPARRREFRYVVADAESLTVTQQLRSNQFFTQSGGVPYRLLQGERVMAAPPQLRLLHVAEFEQGHLHPIAPAKDLRATYSASLRFVCDHSKAPQFVIRDCQNGTSKTLVIPRSHYPLFSPCDDRLLVISVTELISVVDPETATVVRSWKLDDKRIMGAVFSTDGRLAAFTSQASEIEVWEVASGTRRAKFSDAAGRRVLWGTTILGVALWCAAWIAIGGRQRQTRSVCLDLVVLSAVVATGFFLRLVLGGYQASPTRPAAIGTITMLVGLSVLAAIWLVFGAGRWSLRLCGAIAALAAIWGGPVWVWSHFQLPANEICLGAMVIALFAALPMLWLRRLGLAMRHESADAAAPAPGWTVQLPLRDLLLFPAAIGAALVVLRLVPLPAVFPWWALGFELLLALTQALVVTLALWVALSPRRAVFRWSVGMVGVLLLSVSAPLAFHGAPLLPLWWYVAVQSAIGMYAFLGMLGLRRCGWRLKRISRAADVPVSQPTRGRKMAD